MLSSMGEGFAAFSEAFSTGQGFGWYQRTADHWHGTDAFTRVALPAGLIGAAIGEMPGLAADITAGSSPGSEDLTERICAAVSSAITYEYGVTSVTTTAAEALACGRGVCQDSAHVMLALCRLPGQPAKYVSGHLVGQGGTHAWTEVIVSRDGHAEAVAFDRVTAAAPIVFRSLRPDA
jgi:hypothetical protein